MRHGIKKAQLNRTASHRRALFASLACALIKDKQIRTTLAKAKAVRPYVERMITFAKKGDLASRRHVLSHLQRQPVVKELFDKIGPYYAERTGGYTRIMKLGFRRGDAAELAIMELVNREGLVGEKEKAEKPDKSAKKAAGKKSRKEKSDTPKAEAKTD